MSDPMCHSLEVFHSTISVMLVDGILTREEKRFVIKLASALGLNETQPSEIYEAIKAGNEVKAEIRLILTKLVRYIPVFEIAIVNASLSRDEFRVLAHLRDIFKIDDEEHEVIEEELQRLSKKNSKTPMSSIKC